MAVSSASSWSDTTDIIASATPVRLKAVKIRCNPDSVLNSYVQLFDSADATPGSTLPDEVIYVPRSDQAGRQVEMNLSYKGKYFHTGLTWFVSTTSTGATAATTSAPLLVDVHYTPGG